MTITKKELEMLVNKLKQNDDLLEKMKESFERNSKYEDEIMNNYEKLVRNCEKNMHIASVLSLKKRELLEAVTNKLHLMLFILMEKELNMNSYFTEENSPMIESILEEFSEKMENTMEKSSLLLKKFEEEEVVNTGLELSNVVQKQIDKIFKETKKKLEKLSKEDWEDPFEEYQIFIDEYFENGDETNLTVLTEMIKRKNG